MKTSIPPETEAPATALSTSLGISDTVIGNVFLALAASAFLLGLIFRRKKRRGDGDTGTSSWFDGDGDGGD